MLIAFQNHRLAYPSTALVRSFLPSATGPGSRRRGSHGPGLACYKTYPRTSVALMLLVFPSDAYSSGLDASLTRAAKLTRYKAQQ